MISSPMVASELRHVLIMKRSRHFCARFVRCRDTARHLGLVSKSALIKFISSSFGMPPAGC